MTGAGQFRLPLTHSYRRESSPVALQHWLVNSVGPADCRTIQHGPVDRIGPVVPTARLKRIIGTLSYGSRTNRMSGNANRLITINSLKSLAYAIIDACCVMRFSRSARPVSLDGSSIAAVGSLRA